MRLEGSPAEACPRCGDQTLWSHNKGVAWCRLCGHEWAYPPRPNVYRCEDPEGDWLEEQKREVAEARAEHWAEARAVEDHQERKHSGRQ